MKRVNRRNILRTGAYMGTGMTASRLTQMFNASREMGSVHFNEIALTHRGAPNELTNDSDDYVRYYVDEDQSEILYTSAAKDDNVKMARDKSAILRHRRGQTDFPHSRSEQNTPQTLVSSLGHIYTPSTTLSILSGYTAPSISISQGNSKHIQVVVNGEKYSVAPNSGEAIELEAQDVEVRTRGKVKEVEDQRSPGETTLIRERGTKTIQITPILHFRNNGELVVKREKE